MKRFLRITAFLTAALLLIFAVCSCSQKSGGSSDTTNDSIPTGVGRNDTAKDTDDDLSPSGAGRTIDAVPATEEEAIEKTVFVGDSICSGFRVYGIIPPNNNLAVGNVGARSIFDYEFTVDGENYDLITALMLVDPSFIVFSMGMNDINMTSEQEYCDNYDGIIDKVRAALPDAKLFVASITPTRNTASFTNARIDLFNETLKAHYDGTDVHYIDVNSALKDGATNSLAAAYDGGDGIHLSPEAYGIIKDTFYAYCKSIGLVA